MFKRLIHKISAERVDAENPFLPPFFYQQQKAYSFCLNFIKDKSVLEVGSGSGCGTYKLAKTAKNVLGIDDDEISIKKSIGKYVTDNLKFMHSKMEDYKDRQKFDVVIALQVLEHIENPQVFLERIISVIKKDGLFLVSTPNRKTQSYNENPYHYREYSFRELNSILSKYFKEVELYSLLGNKTVKRFEEMRRKHVLKILEKDRLKLRRFIPRRFRQLVFDLAAFLNRALYNQKNKKFNNEILENNYKVIKGNMSNSIDILAVCK